MAKDRVLYTINIQIWDGINNKFLGVIDLSKRRFESREWAEKYFRYLEKLARRVFPTFDRMAYYNNGMGAIYDAICKELEEKKLGLNQSEMKVVYELCRWKYFKLFPYNKVSQIVVHPIYVTKRIDGWKRVDHGEEE